MTKGNGGANTRCARTPAAKAVLTDRVNAAALIFDWFIDKPSLSVPGIDEETDTTPVLAPVGPPP